MRPLAPGSRGSEEEQGYRVCENVARRPSLRKPVNRDNGMAD